MKIYLGYAAGVGKTYQMLLEARRLTENGVDVAIGIVETHGRAETEALVTGLEVIPHRKIIYHGIEIEEMDLDAILARKPSVVLVDELAHTNVPGSKNTKRYQDVEEILSAGIHVISALNIQHIESLYETVERATGVKVRERIPDRVILEADQLVNVDVSSQDLRQRLVDGKVYTKERIETALGHFFTSANLEQLRELTLRELAAQIDSRQRESIADDRPSSPDQVMVCLSSKGPNSEALLRYASRLAGRLNRNWYAVYVQTSREHPAIIDAATQRILSDTLALAQQLGATVFTYRGDDIVNTILQFAREYRVGHIVIGSPGRYVPFWQRVCGRVSLVEQLINKGDGITVVVLDTRTISSDQQGWSTHTTGKNPRYPEKNLIWESNKTVCNAPVLIWNEILGKDDAIRLLVDACNLENVETKNIALEALYAREQLGGTFVGDDVAIPHARIAGLREPVFAVGISKAGILNSQTRQKVKIMFLLISPTLSPENHLDMLSVISRMARDDQWRRQIIEASDILAVKKVIHEWEEQLQRRFI